NCRATFASARATPKSRRQAARRQRWKTQSAWTLSSCRLLVEEFPEAIIDRAELRVDLWRHHFVSRATDEVRLLCAYANGMAQCDDPDHQDDNKQQQFRIIPNLGICL